jgi:acetolactate synthase-1/2/3 large subunit
MKLSDYVLGFLAGQGVRHVFEVIGGAIAHLLDSTYGRTDIRCISVRHEQAAAFAAEGVARYSGNLGVAMATSGPGATNLITGIASAYFDSTPCLYITGQVNTYEYKYNRPVRQIGFQETDIVSIVRPIVKYAAFVDDPLRIRYELEKASYLARSGRPGPVLLDIPMNVQRAEVDPGELPSFLGSPEHRDRAENPDPSTEDVEEAARQLLGAERPVILAGGGVRLSGGVGELARVADRSGAPVAVTLMGLDAIPHCHSSFCGMVGAYGNRYSNLAVANADFLLIVGTRLDTRITGTRPASFARGARILHVDVDPNELGQKIRTARCVRADAKSFLSALADALPGIAKERGAWNARIDRWRMMYPTTPPSPPGDSLDPNRFVRILSEGASDGAVIAVDVGQHQMWVAQSFSLQRTQRALISGGMGSMGFALPAAIGACLASGGGETIVVAGDGGFQMNIQEMQTVVHHALPLKMVVMNNRSLGMVRQFQETYFDGRLQSTVIGYSAPDFVRVAKAYGIPAAKIRTEGGTRAAVRRMFSAKGPFLLEVELGQQTQVNPKLLVNRPIEDMFPFLPREELCAEMIVPPLEEE